MFEHAFIDLLLASLLCNEILWFVIDSIAVLVRIYSFASNLPFSLNSVFHNIYCCFITMFPGSFLFYFLVDPVSICTPLFSVEYKSGKFKKTWQFSGLLTAVKLFLAMVVSLWFLMMWSDNPRLWTTLTALDWKVWLVNLFYACISYSNKLISYLSI